MAINSATEGRVERSLRIAANQGANLLLFASPSELRYLAGADLHPGERPILLAVGNGRSPLLLAPKLEAVALDNLTRVDVLPYEETDDPLAALIEALQLAPKQVIAISDSARADVLLRLQAILPDARFVLASPILRQVRMVKSEEELDLLARAAHLADAAFVKLAQMPLRGQTERHIARILGDLLSEEGLQPADWGPIVGSGPNSALPHHTTSDRVLTEGDAVLLDYGGVLEGYQADITRTVHLGPPDEEFVQIYDTVRAAQAVGVEAAGPGVTAQDVDRAVRRVIESAGYGAYFIHRTGHGLGLDTHEEPYIVEGNDLVLTPGMVFSVEPGIYLPGRFGVRIEDIVAVTPEGSIRLNQADRELLIL